MKVAIYNGPHAVEVVEVPTPAIGDDDVLIQNLHAGVCGTDVAVYLHGPEAHRNTIGDEFGHEMISRVAAVGKNVTEFHVGERVYPYPLLARGDTSRAGTLGGFSECILVPHPKPGVELYPVSDAISDKAGALIEPLTVAMHAAKQGQPQPGETAVVWGAGTIGIGAAVGLRRLGIEKVLIADLSDFRLGIAAGLGFETVNPGSSDLVTKATELFGTAPSLTGPTANVDIYVDAAGADSLIATFQDIGKITARLVVVAVHSTPIPVDFSRLSFASQRISGSGGYTPQDVRDVLALLESGEVDIESIVTHEFPLDQIVTALETAADANTALNVSIVHDTAR
ncbi:MAG: zinc-dependent alcohol dehydrogenase [Ancrocorticia sp.]|uniref:zinc-dependent alcohol dehydrogenase n=1 Tax=Ancrocorticia sp. TaxID=2593684 RepID=UPI003F8F3B87